SRMVSAAAQEWLWSRFPQPSAQPIQQAPGVSKPEIDRIPPDSTFSTAGPSTQSAPEPQSPPGSVGGPALSKEPLGPSRVLLPLVSARPEREQRIVMLIVLTVVILLTAIGASSFIIFAPFAHNPAALPTQSGGPPPPATTASPPGQGIPDRDGVTRISDIAGSGCSQLPTEGAGSAAGMVDDPVATAASNNPLLSTLVAAVKAASLVDTLNSAEAITVFAPINSAFEALPPGTVEQLTTAPDVAEGTSKLSQILTTHVVGTRYNAEGLSSAGTVESLQGSELTIGGTAPDALTVSSGGVTAKIVCGNVPTANATVFLIDKVMMPAAS
ncbi:MAG: fasciclin domain-containing protein, partial [Actinomycetes bacterium]